MSTPAYRIVLVVVLSGGLLVGATGTAWASKWVVGLASGSKGEAKTQAAPAAPTGVVTACTSASGKTIKVTWSAVTHAASYSIYESTSTTSTPGSFNLVASNATGTSWTSATLSSSNNYWFEVAAAIGTNWLGAKSSSTSESTISSSGCVQP